MPTKITPRLIELTYEAALKSFWRKSALRKFLRASHVSNNLLGTWAEEESKRDFLDRAFAELQSTDKGKAVIFQMARSLSEQTTFPDLRNWEDSDDKIADAQRAVRDLHTYLRKQDRQIRTEKHRDEAKKKAQAAQAKIQRSLTDKAALQSRLDGLHAKVAHRMEDMSFKIGSMTSSTSSTLTIGVLT